MGTGRGRLPGWLASAGALLAVLVVATWQPHQASTGATEPGPDQSAGDVRTAGAPAVTSARRTTQPGVPRRLSIPALGVAAPVVPVRASRDTLVPPDDPRKLGWWAGGARPGDQRGSALVAGHTVHTGGGALDDLERLTAGDRVEVTTPRARIGYEVERVRVYSKGRIARDAERLFSQEVPGRLVLVTCEDWDGSRYLSNVVVVARPVGR